MINKIIKITVEQIIMWVVVWLADMIRYVNNDFIEFICLFIAPICLLVKYALIWVSSHLYDKKSRLLKWIVQYVIFLAVWWLETYFTVMAIFKLIEADKWIIRNQALNAGWTYWVWMWFAAIIPAVAIIMHILCTVIKRFSICDIVCKVVNILFVIGVVVIVYFGMDAQGAASQYYFVAIILEAIACFFFNWCYYKVQ